MDKCLSCGFDVDVEGKELCWYCYGKRNIGNSKFVLFNAMMENGNEFLTVQECLMVCNAYRRSIDKPETTYRGVYQILARYSKFYEEASKRGSGFLLLKKKTSYSKLNKSHYKTRKTGASNGVMYKYKLSKRLQNRVKKYNKRWSLGLPIKIANKNMKSFLILTEEKNKARAIRNKIDSKEYDLFEYLLV